MKLIPQRNAWIKFIGSSNKSIAIAYKGILNNYGHWIVGAEVSSLGEKNNVRYGA